MVVMLLYFNESKYSESNCSYCILGCLRFQHCPLAIANSRMIFTGIRQEKKEKSMSQLDLENDRALCE